MDKATFDIEALDPWQKDLLVTAYKYKGLGTLQVTGRQHGKSQLVAYSRMLKDILEPDAKVTSMATGEGTVYGSRYYTVEPVGGNWLEMEKWCIEVFGEGSRALWGEAKVPEPARRWYANNRKFWFKSEKDRDWFIIRWRA